MTLDELFVPYLVPWQVNIYLYIAYKSSWHYLSLYVDGGTMHRLHELWDSWSRCIVVPETVHTPSSAGHSGEVSPSTQPLGRMDYAKSAEGCPQYIDVSITNIVVTKQFNICVCRSNTTTLIRYSLLNPYVAYYEHLCDNKVLNVT